MKKLLTFNEILLKSIHQFIAERLLKNYLNTVLHDMALIPGQNQNLVSIKKRVGHNQTKEYALVKICVT